MLRSRVLAFAALGGLATAPLLAARPQGSVVFLIVEGNGAEVPYSLVPMACYHAGLGRLAAGEACASLIPPGSEVGMVNGARVRLAGRVPVQCDVAPRVTGFRPVGSGAGPAFWPPAATGLLREVPAGDRPGPSKREQKQVRLAVAAHLAARSTLAIHQALDLDLDGDGTPERVFSMEASRQGSTTWVGLVGMVGQKASLLIREPEDALDLALHVRGVMDLDGDGRSELWVSGTGTDLSLQYVMEYSGGVLRRLSRWHDCSPP